MARVSGRARFCHHCGTPVLAAQAAAGENAYRCPACQGGRPLSSRRLGRANVALFECSSCAGLWIEKEIFEVMTDRARSGQLPEGFGGGGPAEMEAAPPAQPLQYRPCVTCGALMNRRNYGRKSGVIVDVCARHGIWFDLHELDRLLRWIREGGRRAERSSGSRAHESGRRLGESLQPGISRNRSACGHRPRRLLGRWRASSSPGLVSGAIRWFFK